MNNTLLLSVIIPLAPSEAAWRTLMPQLTVLTNDVEILLLTAHHADAELLIRTFKTHRNIRILLGDAQQSGRAQLMNLGAQNAQGQYLWFLHADTHLPNNFSHTIFNIIRQQHQAIYYFDLEFLPDGPAAMRFNSRGVYFRSHCLHLPFGDQALLISRAVFNTLGCYNASAYYGEDHLLIWQAHLHSIPVLPIGNTVLTSARKYQQQGWLATSLRHLFLTLQQAIPPFYQLLKIRLVNKIQP